VNFWAWLQIEEGDVLRIRAFIGTPFASLKETLIPIETAASMQRQKR
jgi:hypothetical protein